LEARKFAAGLKKLGVVVFEPYFHSGQDEWAHLSDDYKKFVALGLTHDHFYKIKMADVVFLFNKDGYSGNSSTLELGYSVALGKPVYALSDKDEELCRKVLIREVITTPKELLKRLK
jgi:nucleoside 2-deoxyribosyltransferase